MYAMMGRMCAYSLVHLGQPPCFFDDMTYALIAKGTEGVDAKIDDISDPDLRNMVQQVFKNAMYHCPYLYQHRYLDALMIKAIDCRGQVVRGSALRRY